MRYLLVAFFLVFLLVVLDYALGYMTVMSFFSSLKPAPAAQVVAPPISKPFKAIQDMQPYLITVEPKTKPECLQVSHGELNPAYVRCISGYQQQVVKDSTGQIRVLSERPIPMR